MELVEECSNDMLPGTCTKDSNSRRLKLTYTSVHRKALRIIPSSIMFQFLLLVLTMKLHIAHAQSCTRVDPPTLSNLHDTVDKSRGLLRLCPFKISGDNCDVEGQPYVSEFRRLQMICMDSDNSGCKIDCSGRHFEVDSGKQLFLEGFELRGATDSSINVKSRAVLISKYNKFVRNKAVKGGAIKSDKNSRVQLQFNEFFNNEADDSGGALYMEGMFVTVSGCSFVENVAVNGGGIYVASLQESRRLNVVQSTFASNSATFNGASIHLDGSNIFYFESKNLGCDNADPADCNGAFKSDVTCEEFEGVCESPTAYPTPRKSLILYFQWICCHHIIY
jgi:hypothetical protein